jgi:hypothetical protein
MLQAEATEKKKEKKKRLFRFPEIDSISIDWIQLSGFHLKTKTESSL